MAMYRVEERTYLTLDGRATTNELEANELLANGGDEIPMERAVELGLVEVEGASEQGASEQGASEQGEAPVEPTKHEVMAAYALELKPLKVAQLREAAEARELSAEGKADDIRARLMEAFSDAYDAEHAEGSTEAVGDGADPDPDVVDD